MTSTQSRAPVAVNSSQPICTRSTDEASDGASVILHPSQTDYSSKEAECQAFLYLTEEVTTKYSIGDLLGYGGGGSVYEGVRKSDATQIAIKFVLRDETCGMITIPGEATRIPTEVALMQMVSKPFRSPYVLELLEWFEIPKFDVLILERPSPCMDLLQFSQHHGAKLSEPLVRDIWFQVIQAVRHCWKRGVFHNDIKLSNILINTETLQIKLIDFGSGDLLQKTPYNYCSGSMEYFPPEWYKQRQYSAHSATIWSLGIVLYQLLHGDVPFLLQREIVNGQPLLRPGLSKACRKLLTSCLLKDPKSRATFSQILRNKWLMEGRRNIRNVPVIGSLVEKMSQFFRR